MKKERGVNRRVALVTGGTRGIGLGISEHLAHEGIHLAVNGIRAEDDVQDALNILREAGIDVVYCRGDIGSSRERGEIIKTIDREFGYLNYLVNNAGVAPLVRMDVLESTEESFERVMRINLQGPHFLTQHVANSMIKNKMADPAFPACIVNVSSISATVASPSRAEYCLSKAALSMSTKIFAVRLSEFDIPVFEVRPGVIQSDMTSSGPVRAKYDALIENGLLLQSRWGTPEDVGRAVAMLVRGDLPYSTGQAIMIDGGLTVERLL